jgi:hypothetical protein
VGEPAVAELAQRLRGQWRAAFVHADPGHELFAVAFVRDADHLRVEDVRGV